MSRKDEDEVTTGHIELDVLDVIDRTDPNVYEDEDGEVWAEFAEYPDPAIVGQMYADSRGMIVGLEGGTRITVHDCECSEPRAECPDGRLFVRRPWRRLWRREWHSTPCNFRDKVPCWHFYTGDEPTDFDEGSSLWFPHDKKGRTLILGHAYSPERPSWDRCTATEQEHYRERIEAPGQTAAFTGGEA